MCLDGMYIPGQVEGVCGWDVNSRPGRGYAWMGCIFQAKQRVCGWGVYSRPGRGCV